ncbi:MAG: hypothetical protein IIU25_04000 [Oscillospiraceae bacterium]|nr:hypothetical protein [Oscillospiraceae bacterium]
MKKSLEQLEKEKVRSLLIAGGIISAFGILLFFIRDNTVTSATSYIVGSIFLIAGLVILARGVIAKKKGIEYDDPNSPKAIAHKNKILSRLPKERETSHRHGSFHDETKVYSVTLGGIFMGVMFAINLALLIFKGSIYWLMLIMLIISIIVFVALVLNKEDKKLMAAAAEKGYDINEINADFAVSACYHNSFFAIGRKFLFTNDLLVPLSGLIWAFPRKQWVYNYINGIYTGRSNRFFLELYFDNGRSVELSCQEMTCYLAIDELRSVLPSLTTGYSKELADALYQYEKDPHSFPGDATLPDIYAFAEPTPDNT